jgi:hypothetical protein
VNDEPIILPKPTAVGIPVQESKWAVATKFLSWLTGCFLAISVLVALVSVTSERNDLRTQLNGNAKTQQCRAAAAVHVNQAIINEQIALAEHNVAVGDFINLIIAGSDTPNYAQKLNDLSVRITTVDERLSRIGSDLQKAVDQQQKAILSC